MKSRVFFTGWAVASIILGGCSPFIKKVPKAVPLKFPRTDISAGTRQGPRKAGTIMMVNNEGKFVLIDTGIYGAPTQGVALKSMRNGMETAILTVSAERRGEVIVADIVSGKPSRSDVVMQ